MKVYSIVLPDIVLMKKNFTHLNDILKELTRWRDESKIKSG